ncbi:replicative DNA helicase [Oceanibaculum indicum]|nr:replicative DNA helicase [Oceanibaculum indicum]
MNESAALPDPRAQPYRIPPHNREAEQALLGAILINNGAYERVSEFLQKDHFADPVNGRIYEACGKLLERGQMANPITLKNFFDQDGSLADVGGAQYLVKLAASVVTVVNAEDYGRTVYDLYLRRQLIDFGETVVNEAFKHDLDATAESQIEAAEEKLAGLAERGSAEGGSRPIAAALAGMATEAAEARKRGGNALGLETGLADLDRILGGMAPGNLITMGARPAMGKSALACCIARHVAATGTGVGFFSLEMRAEEIAQRLAADATEIAYDRIRRGALDDDEYARLKDAERRLSGLPLEFDDTAGLAIGQIRARARRMRRRRRVGLIVIDHLHLVRSSGENRLQELRRISSGLKEMARELEVPVLALCQLNRGVEGREDKRPQLSDLRESGSIEQDSDAVIFLYRRSYYLEREQPQRRSGEDQIAYTGRLADWSASAAAERNKAELIVAKNRHGRTGMAAVFCDLALSRFRSLAPERS